MLFPTSWRNGQDEQLSKLHVSVDASEIVYSCAVYIRMAARDGAFQCALMSAKTKDSTTARSWIRSDLRRYKLFVSHRVGEILETTEWRWVASKLNPVDEAKKWGRGPYFSRDSQWFNGPEFLRHPEEAWPRKDDAIGSTAEDIRPSVLFHFAVDPTLNFSIPFFKWPKRRKK